MSFLAIASVTNALAQLLIKKLNKPPLLGNAFTFRVTTLPPDDDRVSEDTGINLFLYRVSEHPHFKNMPWRGDRAHLTGSMRPPLALTLNYLMTAYAKRVANGSQDDITAHQLLGNAMAVFNDYAVLNDIHDSDFDADVDALFAAELRDAFEKVKVSLMPVAIDEFSKIWTGLTKAYRLSVAYDVSLVQIAPQVPTRLPPPMAQRPIVLAAPISSPVVDSVTPTSGSVGTQVTLSGTAFTAPGSATSVRIGGITLEAPELVSVSADQIVFVVPASLTRGPSTEITVTVGPSQSNAVHYLVQPWIATLLPLRGNTGLPVAIPFEAPAGATIAGEVDGQAIATTINAARTIVTVVIPAGLATNGLKPVTLVVSDPTPRRTNALLYEVMPTITTFTVTTPGAPPHTRVAVQGERLVGTDVHLRFGRLVARVGETTNAINLNFQFDRLLTDGTGPVSVIVDGRESNSLPRRITRIDPPQAGAGERVTLVGTALSGRSVVVHVGGQDITVGAQPFASRFDVQVPAMLAPGAVTFSATIDGTDTNTTPFTVIA
jgi:hypothetical protein